MSQEQSLLTIVEELKDLQMQHFLGEIYRPEFWLPFIPLKNKSIIAVEHQKQFYFEVKDTIILDPTGLLKKDLDAKGNLYVVDHGEQGTQGRLWDISIKIDNFHAEVGVRVRAKDLPTSMKVGIYIYKIDYDWGSMPGIGKDAILFGARVKIRELMQEIQRKLSANDS